MSPAWRRLFPAIPATASTAQYETVSTGTTGHAESLKITYDPAIVSYGALLRIFAPSRQTQPNSTTRGRIMGRNTGA